MNRKSNTKNIILAALFAALIAIGAFIRIPIPYISFTLQSLFVALAAILLGAKWGTISVLVYIAIGLVGLPVFTQGGGFGYIFQPSFGFLIGFALWTLVSGRIIQKRKATTVKSLFLAQLPGVGVMYAVGLVYFYLMQNFYQNEPMTVQTLLYYCFITTFPWDLLKCLFAAWVGKKTLPIINK